MICVNWNLQWTEASSPRGEAIRSILCRLEPSVICLTEANLGIEPPDGHRISSDPDYGYRHNGPRRKVVLWSRSPWSEIDTIGAEDMPPGRFVSGITEGIRFVGVCIPWKEAHVRSGRRDREPWEDHLAYLEAIGPLLRRYQDAGVPCCMVGDFNQRVPRRYQPVRVAKALTDALGEELTLATEGVTDEEGKLLIDHCAHTQRLGVRVVDTISRKADGLTLSDHTGVVLSVEVAG